MTFMLTFDLDLDVMTYFFYKTKAKGQDLGHYPAKLVNIAHLHKMFCLYF